MNAMTIINTMAAMVIFVWAVWCVFGRLVHDGLVGKIIYSVAGVAAFSILVGAQGSAPNITLNLCLAALAARHFVLRTYWPRIRCAFMRKPFHHHHRRESDGI